MEYLPFINFGFFVSEVDCCKIHFILGVISILTVSKSQLAIITEKMRLPGNTSQSEHFYEELIKIDKIQFEIDEDRQKLIFAFPR